jgi:hypothetical protein
VSCATIEAHHGRRHDRQHGLRQRGCNGFIVARDRQTSPRFLALSARLRQLHTVVSYGLGGDNADTILHGETTTIPAKSFSAWAAAR